MSSERDATSAAPLVPSSLVSLTRRELREQERVASLAPPVEEAPLTTDLDTPDLEPAALIERNTSAQGADATDPVADHTLLAPESTATSSTASSAA